MYNGQLCTYWCIARNVLGRSMVPSRHIVKYSTADLLLIESITSLHLTPSISIVSVSIPAPSLPITADDCPTRPARATNYVGNYRSFDPAPVGDCGGSCRSLFGLGPLETCATIDRRTSPKGQYEPGRSRISTQAVRCKHPTMNQFTDTRSRLLSLLALVAQPSSPSLVLLS
nr:hypothetical protein CFP56_24325 [Quercus suber]